MAREERGRRPFKIWDSWRNIRKSLVVNSLKDLEFRGKEKLQVPASEAVRLVLESDGTQVEDGEYFRTLPNNTVILLLRPGERWYPTGVDVIRTAISAIPKIVCETIHALELQDETPSWKIMDNKGRVTVVLHWDQRQQGGGGGGGGSGKTSAVPGGSEAGTAASSGTVTPKKQSSLVIQTSVDGAGRKETLINDVYPARYTASPQITVINHDDLDRVGSGGVPWSGAHPPRLTKQGSSFESATAIHVHTPECVDHAHRPAGTSSRAGSPSNNGTSECDFHCCALHEEGRKIAVHKSVATSPIQDSLSASPQQHPSSISDGSRRAAGMPPKGHVRFLDVEGCSSARQQHRGATTSSTSQLQQHHHHHDAANSSESETETTVIEDEAVTTEKFLLLIDQLSVDQKRHLTIKDIGIILERLSSKILDVERLDRECEGEDCYNWTIKATIRGDVLRELGVIYNGNYYAISEHPGYKEESEEVHDDEEDVEEEDDRL